MRKTGVIWDPIFIEHINADTGHPESPERLIGIYDFLQQSGLSEQVFRLPKKLATEDDILLNHSKAHFDRIASSAGKSFTVFDPDTLATAQSFKAAMYAVGSGIELVDAVWAEELQNAFLLGRPPGHHALSGRTMGFCLFNSIAIAAAHLVQRHKVRRVAIVDFDVHHGNGTQESFYDNGNVLYCSSHQSPYFPGTGAISEIGNGPGRGLTVNVPLAAGQMDDDYLLLYENLFIPILEEYRPQIILVSAGYDIHQKDPIGGMNVSTPAVAQLAEMLVSAAERICDGKIAFFLEGGYSISALKQSVGWSLRALLGDTKDLKRQQFVLQESVMQEMMLIVRQNLDNYWTCVANLKI